MRQPKPWYRASKSAWFVEFDGRQVRLAKGPKAESEKAAYEAYFLLMARRPGTVPAPASLVTVLLCDLFLDHSKARHAPATYDLYRHFLRKFCKAHGRVPAVDIRPFHVSRRLDAHPKWKASRRHAALAVKGAFAWADKQGLLSPSPLRAVEVEPGNRRTRVLSAGGLAEILAAIKDPQFREFVRAMVETGCRPGEVARVTAADADLELGVWVLARHKTARKTGRPRVVYLNPAMAELTRTLVAKHPDGPLFRGL